jgi:pimeloyl-ACP methyl ester carboxylesterase
VCRGQDIGKCRRADLPPDHPTDRITFDDLQRASPPTLILVGDRDPLCSVDEGLQAYQALPNGELAVLPGTGHRITPSGVRATVEFFERHLTDA